MKKMLLLCVSLLLSACVTRQVTTQQALSSGSASFRDYINTTLCRKLSLPSLEQNRVVLSDGGYLVVDSCKPEGSTGWRLTIYGQESVIDKLLYGFVQDYCGSHRALFVTTRTDRTALAHSAASSFYSRKAKNVGLPRYYKDQLRSRYYSAVLSTLVPGGSTGHRACCVSNSDAFCVHFEAQRGPLLSSKRTYVLHFTQKDLNQVLQRAFDQAYSQVQEQIQQDKTPLMWTGVKIRSSRPGLTLISMSLDRDMSGRLSLSLWVHNSGKAPAEINLLRGKGFVRRGYRYPVTFPVIRRTGEIPYVHTYGECQKLVGNTVVISPEGSCKISVSGVNIPGCHTLHGGRLDIDGLSAVLISHTLYQEHVHEGEHSR